MNKYTTHFLVIFCLLFLGFQPLFSMDQSLKLPSDIWSEIYQKVDPATVGKSSLTCKKQQTAFSDSLNNILQRLKNDPQQFTETLMQYPTAANIQVLNQYYADLTTNNDKEIVIQSLENNWRKCFLEQRKLDLATEKLVLETPFSKKFLEDLRQISPIFYMREDELRNNWKNFSRSLTQASLAFLQSIASQSDLDSRFKAWIDSEIEKRKQTSLLPVKKIKYNLLTLATRISENFSYSMACVLLTAVTLAAIEISLLVYFIEKAEKH